MKRCKFCDWELNREFDGATPDTRYEKALKRTYQELQYVRGPGRVVEVTEYIDCVLRGKHMTEQIDG